MTQQSALSLPIPLPAGAPPPPAVRVSFIARLMAAGAWVTGETGPLLAEGWGLEECTVRRDAAEASRAIKADLGDVDQVRSQVLGMINEARRVGREAEDPAKAAAVLLKAADLIARITGCAAPQRHMVALADGDNDENAWTTTVSDQGEKENQ